MHPERVSGWPLAGASVTVLDIQGQEGHMSVARITEISAESNKSFEDAIVRGIERANKTLKNVRGAWVQDQKITVESGRIAMYRVNLKITFVLEE
jgi:dodecin